MFDPVAVNALPEVSGTILGDRQGGLVEAIDEADAEAVAAISGFTFTQLCGAGEILGLGELTGLTIAGRKMHSLLFGDDDAVLTVRVDSRSPLTTVKRKIEKVLGQGTTR